MAVHQVAPSAWHPLRRSIGGHLVDTDQEWAEVCFVPNAVGHKKDAPLYRFLAIREPLRQPEPSALAKNEPPLMPSCASEVAQFSRAAKMFKCLCPPLYGWHQAGA